jgi:glucokinase
VERTIGVDIGGTKIAAGVVDERGSMLDYLRVPTPDTIEDIDSDIAAVVERLREKHDVVAVGVAAAGFVNEHGTRIRFAPNLPWRDYPLGTNLTERLGQRVVIENDANAAAWAEFQFGAGQDIQDMMLITVGTGVGGGIVLDGQLIRGAFGVAAELGHITMVPDGQICGCGRRGCLEQYGSGTALVRYARALATADPEGARVLLTASGGAVDAIEGHMVTEAAKGGDPLAVAVFAEIGRWLGRGIASLASVLDPAVVVIGGGVADAGDLLLGPVREAYVTSLSGGGYRPQAEIRTAEMGNDAGIIGAADLARRR